MQFFNNFLEKVSLYYLLRSANEVKRTGIIFQLQKSIGWCKELTEIILHCDILEISTYSHCSRVFFFLWLYHLYKQFVNREIAKFIK